MERLRAWCATETATRVTGVIVGGEILEGDAVVIAMGPWSVVAAAWLELPAIFGLKGHSIVFETGERFRPRRCFSNIREADGGMHAPEVFPRPDGTTYVCGISSESPLPVDPADVAPDPGAIERLHAMCRAFSPLLGEAKVLARQACYRPVTRDGLPLIGRIAGVENAYVATGHSVWGMLNAPATGEAMADLIVGGEAAHRPHALRSRPAGPARSGTDCGPDGSAHRQPPPPFT